MAYLAGVQGRIAGHTGAPLTAAWRARVSAWRDEISAAFQCEVDERRLFLWVPVLAGAGAILYLSADREPSLVFASLLFGLASAIAIIARAKPIAFRLAVALAAVCAGMFCGALRNARVAAPVLERIHILKVSGFIEEIDFRKEGARFVLRVAHAEGLKPEEKK